MAIELAVFDLIPQRHLPFARGFTAAFLATTACYPLDTVRYATLSTDLNSGYIMSWQAHRRANAVAVRALTWQ